MRTAETFGHKLWMRFSMGMIQSRLSYAALREATCFEVVKTLFPPL